MVNAQEYINQNIHNKEVTTLDISSKNLEGNLNLSDFANLEKLVCDGNGLTKLDLTNNNKLKSLSCSWNKLTNIKLSKENNLEDLDARVNYLDDINALCSNLNPKKLKSLNLGDNNFSESDLTPFSKLINLEHLGIFSKWYRDEFGIHNRFHGSLEPLQNLYKLSSLDIENTDISGGLEYSPESLKHIGCSGKINEQLSSYENNPQNWKEFNGPVRWFTNEKGKAVKEITLLFPLKKIPSEYWDKVEIKDDWEDKANLLGGHWGSQRFANQDILDGFKKYAANPDSKFYDFAGTWPNNKAPFIKDIKMGDAFDVTCFVDGRRNGDIRPSNMAGFLAKEKLFKNGNYGKATNQETFEYLKLIAGSSDASVKFSRDDEFPLEEWTELYFVEQGLKGKFKLSIFTNLVGLTFDTNQLTELDLSNCKKIVNLKCSGLTELKELDISNCHSLVSLEPLSNLSKLEKLNVTNTNISEGLEHLPENCKWIICNSDRKYKSIEIIEELERYGRCSEREGEDKHYNFYKWKANKQNSITSSLVPLERLFTIRINIKKFLGEWGQKDDGIPSKLSQLRSPEEFNKFRYMSVGKWASRATSVGGGILALTNQPIVGGVVAASSPFVEAISSYIEDNWYLAEESKWNEFTNDTETLLDSYDELLEILKSIEVAKWGQVNKTLKELKEKTYRFLEKHDVNKDREISASELDKARKEMKKDLKENWNEKEIELKEVMEAIRVLSQVVNNYKKGELTGVDESKIEEEKILLTEEVFAKKQITIDEIAEEEQKETIIELEESEQGELTEKIVYEAQIQIPSK